MLEDLIIRPTFFDDDLIEVANNFFNRVSSYDEGPVFEETDNGYEMKIYLEGATIDNFSIEIEDEKYLKISYFYQTENSSTAYSAKELIPFDADASTLEANYNDSLLTISVNKK